tara:strand:- start:246 stop:866 length:621 start_codon:yes stop_codon:yes gene_type:complete
MATLGYVAPHSTQTTEGFHALRRTTEGLLYYTKVNKDSTDSIDFEGGAPTDKNGNSQLPSKLDYTDEKITFQSGGVQYFTGNNSTTTFTITTSVLDSTRILVFLNGLEQPIDKVWTYASGVITFKIAPFSGSQIAIGRINKQYKNNTSDKYHQYIFEEGDATYFIDDNGYFVKRENKSKGATALTTDDFSTAESSTYSVATTSWST